MPDAAESALTGPQRARLARARELWEQGEALVQGGDLAGGWRLLEDAHDRVTDIPWAHREAHRRLLPVNVARGHRDQRTDRLLEALTPLGIWPALALWFRLFGDYTGLD